MRPAENNAEGGAVALSRGFAPRVATCMAATAGLAATAAAMDGPLPFGDIIGGGLLIYDVVTTVFGGAVYSDSDVPSNVGPGEYAEESVPAGPSPRPTKEQQEQINENGDRYGCHTCGTKNPGTKSGNWIGDHQDPTIINAPGKPQVYYPHCVGCSNAQGGRLRWIPKNN